MNKIFKITTAAALMMAVAVPVMSSEIADSVSIFAYKMEQGKGGLRMAWDDNGTWRPIGQGDGYELVKSDFGSWGSGKKMYDPVVFRTPNGWRLLWWVSDSHQTVASADSPDLFNWTPQRYADRSEAAKFMEPSIVRARDAMATVNGKEYSGSMIKLSRPEFMDLCSYAFHRVAAEQRNDERVTADTLYPDLHKTVRLTAKRNHKPTVKVSPHLFGIFFEDINYGADGGLYAELVQNRDFEYMKGEGGGNWGPAYAWSLTEAGKPVELTIVTADPIHANNSHYITIPEATAARQLVNTGYDGITVRKGVDYRLSMFVRTPDGRPVRLSVELVKGKRVIGSAQMTVNGTGWQKVETTMKAKAAVSGAELRITIPKGAACDMDMISLFPSDTWKGRVNGLRADMMSALDSIHPRFVRFPGGCVAHGNGVDNIYDWKGSVGPLEARKPLRNLWGYHQTRGLGYYEFFVMCEDLGAEPLPVLAAGVPCQNSSWKSHHSVNELTSCGQQGGIPMDEMPAYIQDVLDLIEYANGPADSKWGSVRAKAGHPESFNLKFIGIGNEDLISEEFEKRFEMIYDAVTKTYPDIKVVGTVGPFYEGSDYDEGWRFARSLNVPLVDEHYYVTPGWLINNRGYYDSYPRGGTDVYLGEYASHIPGRKSNIETALSVALYLTDVERNSDVVKMTSYAPLFAKKNHTQWNPDMIYFDNDKVSPATDYYVQKLFGANQGDEYLPMDLQFDTANPAAARRIGYSAMRDSRTGDVILKMANLLPAKVTVDQEYRGIARRSTLSGTPTDGQVEPVTVTENIEGPVTLPPYSLTVLRFKK